MRRILSAAVCFVAIQCGFAIPASAQSCSAAIDTVHFGTIDLVADIPYDTTSTMHVTCSGSAGTTVRVCANFGAGSGGEAVGGNPRYMINGGDQLQYNLYTDPAHSTVWGTSANAAAIDVSLNAGGTGSASRIIYGRVFANQTGLPVQLYQSSFSGAHSYFSYDYAAAGTCAAIGTSHLTAAPFDVSANDTSACSITANELAFGSFASTAAAVDASTTLTANCSSGTAYTIGLNGGLTGASNPTQRYMLHGADQLRYGLYLDSGHSQPWGNTAGQIASGNGNGTAQVYTVYGRIPIQTTPPAATYSDLVIVTVSY